MNLEIVSPFTDTFQFISNVPYATAKNFINKLNGSPLVGRDNPRPIYGKMPLLVSPDSFLDPVICPITNDFKPRGITHCQTISTPGCITSDDFGTDGDDIPHSRLPNSYQPNYAQVNASFPTNSTTPDTIDVIFPDFFVSSVISALNSFWRELYHGWCELFYGPEFRNAKLLVLGGICEEVLADKCAKLSGWEGGRVLRKIEFHSKNFCESRSQKKNHIKAHWLPWHIVFCSICKNMWENRAYHCAKVYKTTEPVAESCTYC